MSPLPRFKATLRIIDEHGDSYVHAQGTFGAVDEAAAELAAIELWWEPRLDAASCHPVVEVVPWPSTVDEVLELIEEEYGTLDDAWTVAPDVRVGTDHEESAGCVNRCKVCGVLDLDPEDALVAGVDPLMHPEIYGG